MFKLEEALAIAQKTLEQLKPFCDRIEIAGSIRRLSPEVKDIEIVCIPKPYSIGLFEDGIAPVVNQWKATKGQLEYGKCKYTQRILPEGIKLDLFFAEKENWGLILAIRTGSSDYSHKVLATSWVKKGYTSEGGILKKDGKEYPVYEEKDLFERIGIEYIEPHQRNL